MDYFLGIDVSKKTLDLAVLKNGVLLLEQQIENSAKPLRAFLKMVTERWEISTNELVVCMEHTGIYNSVALGVLSKKKLRVCVERALHIKQSMGMVRGKSDRVDARRIAAYAYKNRHELIFWKPQREVIQRIQALLTLRERLLRAKARLAVPIREADGFLSPSIVKQLTAMTSHSLKGLARDITLVQQQLEELVKSDLPVKNQVDKITSIPGIGPITAMNIIVTSGEFTRISEGKKFACYAGVAPFEHSSGTSIRGKNRVSKMANTNVKTLLHLAAMAAIRCDSELKAFYHRKVAEGKNKMSVINAVRNKLISRIYVCVKENRLYQKEYQNALA